MLTPKLLYNQSEYLRQTKLFLKVISNDKEVDKTNARIFAKICHNAPCLVMNEVVKQLRSFSNLIPGVATSMVHLLNFSVELGIFLSLRQMSELGKAKVKEDEGLIESWVQTLSQFIGITVKKYHKVQFFFTKIDLTGIFVFIANKLSSDTDTDAANVILLKEILCKMSGYEPLKDFTPVQFAALSGGMALKTEAFGLAEQVKAYFLFTKAPRSRVNHWLTSSGLLKTTCLSTATMTRPTSSAFLST